MSSSPNFPREFFVWKENNFKSTRVNFKTTGGSSSPIASVPAFLHTSKNAAIMTIAA